MGLGPFVMHNTGLWDWTLEAPANLSRFPCKPHHEVSDPGRYEPGHSAFSSHRTQFPSWAKGPSWAVQAESSY